MSETLIKVDHVAKKFCRNLKRSLWYGIKDVGKELLGRTHGGNGHLRRDEFWALRDVSFEVKRGECLGLLGRNGAGKSTLLKMLNGLLKPDAGRIEMHGRVAALIELGAGFNPILTGRENIYVNGSVLGFTKKEIDRKFDAIVEFSELGEFIDSPVKNYSSGMKVRLGFSVAAQLEPDVLLIDEVLAVGDIGFKIKCYNEIYRLVKSAAVIFVSHQMPQVGRICSRGLVMQDGRVKVASENVAEAINGYNELFDFGGITKFGADRARILAMSVSGDPNAEPQPFDDAQGLTPVTLKQGRPLYIDLVLEVDERVDHFLIHFEFLDMDQRFVAQCPSRQPIRNLAGQIRIRTVMNNFSLNMGKYMMGITIRQSTDGQAAQEVLLGLREVVCLHVRGDGFLGAAPVQYDAVWEFREGSRKGAHSHPAEVSG